MNKRALLIAFVASLLGAALLVIYLRRFEEEASGGEPIKVIVVLKPMESGQVITDDSLATRVIPRAYVEDRTILNAERAKIIGLKIGHTVRAQQTLMWTDLAIAMSKRLDEPVPVQPGMRAIPVRVGDEGDTTALLQPGNRIDVIATMPAEPNSTVSRAVVLLQNVMVLAVGGNIGIDPVERVSNRADSLLHLSLTLPQAQLLALATEKGRITVAQRNPDDVHVTEGITAMPSTVLSDVKEATARGPRPIRIEKGAVR